MRVSLSDLCVALPLLRGLLPFRIKSCAVFLAPSGPPPCSSSPSSSCGCFKGTGHFREAPDRVDALGETGYVSDALGLREALDLLPERSLNRARTLPGGTRSESASAPDAGLYFL